MKSEQTNEEQSINDQNTASEPVSKRKRGRPLKNKNPNQISPNSLQNSKYPLELPIIINEGLNQFSYPPEISFNGFNVDAINNFSRFSSELLMNSLNSIVDIWWKGQFPVLIDDSNILKYDLSYQFLNILNNYFRDLEPILLVCNEETQNRWISTFQNYDCYLFSENSQPPKTKIDVYILSNLSLISELHIKSFNFAIFDTNDVSPFTEFDIKSSLLISNSGQTIDLPSPFNTDTPIVINLDDLKNNCYINETLCFCPMSIFQILQLQQLFKSIKSRLVAISNTPSERLTLFVSHMIEQVRTISVQPTPHGPSFSSHDEPSGKLEKLLEMVSELQSKERKVAILAADPQFLNTVSSFFNRNEIDVLSVSFNLKHKKRIQYIEEFNSSDSESILLIGQTHFLEFIPILQFDTLIILDADISLSSLIEPILLWMQKNHDVKPQVLRLITDNSIELPIYEMQFEDKNGEFNIEKVNSDTSLLLLKQSANFCFNYENYEIKPSVEVCYSCSTPIFEFETDFGPDFWNEIEMKQPIQKIENSPTKNSQGDDSSIAARVKKSKEKPIKGKDKKITEAKKTVKEERAQSPTKISKNRQSPRRTSRQDYADIASEDYEEEYEYEYEYQTYEYQTQSDEDNDDESHKEEESDEDPNLSMGERRRRRMEKQKNKEKAKRIQQEEKKSKDKKSSKPKVEKVVETKPESPIKPKKHIPKFDAMVSFWTAQQFNLYLGIVRDFGFDRWDKFASFNRPIQELRKIGALIIRNLETTSKENRLLREYFANELRSSELSRLDNALPFVGNKLFKVVTRENFLADLTGMLKVARMHPKSPKDIILPRLVSELGPFDDKWTDDDDRTLLYMIYEHGLLHLPQTLRHGQTDELIHRFRQMFLDNPSLNTTKPSTDSKTKIKEKPSYLQTKSVILSKSRSKSEMSEINDRSSKRSRTIGSKDHLKIVNNLCSYGFPSLELFKSQINLPETISDEHLQEYIDHILQFCHTSDKEEKRVIANHFAGKIEKYTASKILARMSMFEKLRTDSFAYNEISQEDIEILSAMNFHGFQNTSMSPILLTLCGGECSDSRLYQRVKAISAQKQIAINYKLPFYNEENIFSEEMIVPLKINEMQVLKSIGKIDPRFHTKDYVYPIDYEIAVGCISPFSDAGLIWLNASVRLNQSDDKLQFVVRKEKERSAEIVDDSPDEVFEKVRQKIIKRNRMWIPPIDGHEMFGFKSAKFHRLLLDMPNIELCDKYQKRFFRLPFIVSHDWPILGRYEDKRKQFQLYYGSNGTFMTQPGDHNSKTNAVSTPRSPTVRKKDFGSLTRPIVLDCRFLFNANQENASISVSGSHLPFEDIMNRYEVWDKDRLQNYRKDQDDQ